MPDEMRPEEFKARMIDRHRAAFDLWRRCHEMLEGVVPQGRDVTLPFARALDLLFIQAFKSHASLYVLCVRGHGEDGATILRRMLEIAFQVQYMCSEPGQRDSRAEKYLAWFWLQANARIKAGLPNSQKDWWQRRYDAHKHLITRPTGQPLRNWWGDSGIKDLAYSLGLQSTYDEDYRFLSQMAHCTAQGFLLDKRGSTVEIRTDMLVREILVFGTRYVVSIAKFWNDHFGLLNLAELATLAQEALDFDFTPPS